MKRTLMAMAAMAALVLLMAGPSAATTDSSVDVLRAADDDEYDEDQSDHRDRDDNHEDTDESGEGEITVEQARQLAESDGEITGVVKSWAIVVVGLIVGAAAVIGAGVGFMQARRRP